MIVYRILFHFIGRDVMYSDIVVKFHITVLFIYFERKMLGSFKSGCSPENNGMVSYVDDTIYILHRVGLLLSLPFHFQMPSSSSG